jgi:broad specificity phosphatase PhoE
MPRLYLIRHSIPQIDPLLPASQWELSEEGITRARSLANDLLTSGSNVDVIVSSIEPKARETARILGETLDKPFSVVAGLHEHERTNLPFLERSQFEAKIEEFFANPAQLVLGDETADQAYSRFALAVVGIIESHQGKDIAVVSHGTVISLFVSRVAGIEPFPFWQRLQMPHLVTLSLPDLRLT